MEGALHRFVRLLRLHGMRVSVSEAIDAMHAAAQPGVLADRELLRAALTVTLVKDRRDVEVFDKVFDRFFGLRAVVPPEEEGHSHAHDDLSDEGDLEEFTLSDNPGDNPQQGHSHGKPDDLRSYFDPEDLAQQYNLHQEANRLDMSALTDEIVLSNDTKTSDAQAARVQLSTDRMRNPGNPGELTTSPGLEIDTELSVAEEMALFDWLQDNLPDDDTEDLEVPDNIAAAAGRPRATARGPAGAAQGAPAEAALGGEGDRDPRARGRAGRHPRRGRAGRPRGVAAPAAAQPARCAAAASGHRRPGRGGRAAHDAGEHEVRRRAVPSGDGQQGRGPAPAAGALRRVAVGAQHRAVHAAPGAQPAVGGRAGPQLRVRQGPGRDHRPVRRAPDRGRALPGAGGPAGRRDARRGRGLRLRHRVRAVPGAVRLRRHPPYDVAGPRRRTGERQRPAGAGVRGARPGAPGRRSGSPPSRATRGAWAGATCRPTRSSATGCRWSATCTAWRR